MVDFSPMANGSLPRRELIRRKLAHQPQADGRAVAEIAAQMWGRVVSQVSPVIGDEGVRALYRRSLHLTKVALPRFAEFNNEQSLRSFNELLPRLEPLDAADVSAFSSALLITFTELLATLIGEGLTTRLTQSAWTEDLVSPDPTTGALA
jgi:hypothetical protein